MTGAAKVAVAVVAAHHLYLALREASASMLPKGIADFDSGERSQQTTALLGRTTPVSGALTVVLLLAIFYSSSRGALLALAACLVWSVATARSARRPALLLRAMPATGALIVIALSS